MIIASSNVNMASDRTYKKREASYTRYDSSVTTTEINVTADDFRNYVNRIYGESDNNATPEPPKETNEDVTSETPLQDLKELLSSSSQSIKNNMIQSQIDQIKEIRSRIIDYLLEMLFGRGKAADFTQSTEDISGEQINSNVTQTYTIGYSTVSTINYYEYSEEESVNFTTTGTVNTSDGRTIDFGINVNLSRSFVEQSSNQIDYTQPLCIDPLVINVDSSFVGISDQTFLFDLDMDGEAEEMKGLTSGSGFLAYDKNENGTIDDGSELFGTSSGNGFKDLAQYDDDGNGWIDEADSIFSKLKVWCKEKDGSDSFINLKEAGVGAIYLGSSEGDFSLNDQNNKTDAVIRRHGIFLYENGNVGTIQQVDMAVQTDYSA